MTQQKRAQSFQFAHAKARTTADALGDLIQQLLSEDYTEANLGLLYINHAAGASYQLIEREISQAFPNTEWTGAIVHSVLADTHEYADEPAIAAMIMPLTPGDWHIFGGATPIHPDAFTALVHADPLAPELPALLVELADRTQCGYLFGGLTDAIPGSADQIAAGQRIGGGLSGVGFSERVSVLSRVTQGCKTLGQKHRITSSGSRFIHSLDGRPALDVLLADLGVDTDAQQTTNEEQLLRALPVELLHSGLLVGLSETIPDKPMIGFGDYQVHNLAGIDPGKRYIAVDGSPEKGNHLIFCTRSQSAARADLVRVCTELRDEVESSSLNILGAHYVSCAARGKSLFGSAGVEAQILKHNLGDVPIVGFYAAGEITRDRLYSYSGVLTLFVEPA